MATIEIYASDFCPYCRWAKALLDGKGLSYHEIKVDGQPEQRQEMINRSQRTSVPQIFINNTHVGGFDDLSALDRNGGLNELLQQQPD